MKSVTRSSTYYRGPRACTGSRGVDSTALIRMHDAAARRHAFHQRETVTAAIRDNDAGQPRSEKERRCSRLSGHNGVTVCRMQRIPLATLSLSTCGSSRGAQRSKVIPRTRKDVTHGQ